MAKYMSFIIIIILAGLLIFGWINQGAKDRAYQNDIAELEREREELRETTTELRTDIKGLEKERSELEKIDRENREILRRFENENSTLRKNIKGFDADLTELEDLLSEFLVD